MYPCDLGIAAPAFCAAPAVDVAVAIMAGAATATPPVARKSRREYFFLAVASSLSALLPPSIALLLTLNIN
jgi:hypothetical protein